MPFSIALAGKGGTGKTTLAGMLVKYLVQKDKAPVLAVDADANANLNEVLGLEVSDTLGNAREEMKKGKVPSGMTKNVFMSMKLEQAVIDADGYDLVVMGQPEGSGCYCAANTLLTGFLEKLTGNYPYVVMDNEAGMEHLSRRTTQNIDELLFISDHSMKGIRTIAFPSISTGAYRFPKDRAARIAVSTLAAYLRSNDTFERVLLACFDGTSANTHRSALARLGD